MAVDLAKLLQLVLDKSAEGLNLEVGAPPGLLLKGSVRPLNLPPLTSEDTLRWMRALAPKPEQRFFAEAGECKFEHVFADTVRFSVTLFRHKGDCCLRLRRLPGPDDGRSGS